MVDQEEIAKGSFEQTFSNLIFKLTLLSHAMKARGVQGEDCWLFSEGKDYWAIGDILDGLARDIETIGRVLYGQSESTTGSGVTR